MTELSTLLFEITSSGAKLYDLELSLKDGRQVQPFQDLALEDNNLELRFDAKFL